MFKNKLNISVDYYHKVTKDLIDYIPTPEQIGVADPPMGNMGNVLNKGWEFSVNYNGSAAQGKLTYNVWGNFSTCLLYTSTLRSASRWSSRTRPVLTCSRKASFPTTRSRNSSKRRNKYFKS